MTVQQSDLVFAFDFDTLMPDGRLRDFGPYGLHASFPGGAANPTRLLDGGYSFDGGDYLSLPLAFYDRAPTGAHSWVALWSLILPTGLVNVVWSCCNTIAGLHYGFELAVDGGVRTRQYQEKATATLDRIQCAYTQTWFKTAAIATVEAAPRELIEGTTAAPAWAAVGFGTAAYNQATVPLIGNSPHVNFGGFLTGRLYYLSLVSRAISTDEQMYLSRELRDNRKPFCWRSP